MFRFCWVVLLLVSSVANAEPAKYLQYKYNDAVTLVISAQACPFNQFKEEYPFTAAAFRIDGDKLAGCYKRQTEDLIEIQWYKGDKTVIPANAFLVKPVTTTPSATPDM